MQFCEQFQEMHRISYFESNNAKAVAEALRDAAVRRPTGRARALAHFSPLALSKSLLALADD